MESFHLLIPHYQQLFYKFLLHKGERISFLEVVIENKLQNLCLQVRVKRNSTIIPLAETSNHRGLNSLLPVFVHWHWYIVDIQYFQLIWQRVALSAEVEMTLRGAGQHGTGSWSNQVERDL